LPVPALTHCMVKTAPIFQMRETEARKEKSDLPKGPRQKVALLGFDPW
jgi:hypothetical protein